MTEQSQYTNTEPHTKIENSVKEFKAILSEIGIKKTSQNLIIDEGLSEVFNQKNLPIHQKMANQKIQHNGYYFDSGNFYEAPITEKLSQLIKTFELKKEIKLFSEPEFSTDRDSLNCTLKLTRLPDSLLKILYKEKLVDKVSDFYVNDKNKIVDYKFGGGQNLTYIHQIDLKADLKQASLNNIDSIVKEELKNIFVNTLKEHALKEHAKNGDATDLKIELSNKTSSRE